MKAAIAEHSISMDGISLDIQKLDTTTLREMSQLCPLHICTESSQGPHPCVRVNEILLEMTTYSLTTKEARPRLDFNILANKIMKYLNAIYHTAEGHIIWE